jgi:large subunit ribosomal protein L18
MPKDKTARHPRLARHIRLRKKVSGTTERPRLAVFRSHTHIYAQIIDDTSGRTLQSASSLDLKRNDSDGEGTKTDWSRRVGAEIAKKAKENGITKVVFDRGGNNYHGRVKALAEAAREEGLVF